MKKIQKFPNKLTKDDMYHLRMMYSIPPYVGLVSIIQHLIETKIQAKDGTFGTIKQYNLVWGFQYLK